MIRFNPVYTLTWLQLSGSETKLKSEIAATGRRVLFPLFLLCNSLTEVSFFREIAVFITEII